LEKSKIIERSLDENDKRKKTIKIRDEIKNKLNKFLD
jgi:DNA-binding MarR family transcriptional regulator